MTRQVTGIILDQTSRDELAVKHLDLVGRVVGRLPISVPKELDREDLLSAGTVGLLKAARTYQPMRGASFRTYAYIAIRAAVLDELRRFDPLPRGARGRLRELQRLEGEFQSREGRLPMPEEICAGLGMTPEETEQLLAHAEEERLLRSRGAPGLPQDRFDPVDPQGSEPLESASRQEELGLVEQAIRDLPARERQVVVLYFSEGLYLKEIGEVLGVTESRICQILACAQRKIRVQLEKMREKQDA
ncbi:MAG: sigma-70 family RNA polymerase sigma factor [Planctomycetota bacterium]